MRYSKKFIIQLLFILILTGIISILISNLSINLVRTGMGLNFNWIAHPSGFAIAEKSLPYKPSDNSKSFFNINFLASGQ